MNLARANVSGSENGFGPGYVSEHSFGLVPLSKNVQFIAKRFCVNPLRSYFVFLNTSMMEVPVSVGINSDTSLIFGWFACFPPHAVLKIQISQVFSRLKYCDLAFDLR